MIKKAIVLIFFIVFASHSRIAQNWSTGLDIYLQLSTGMRLGSQEPEDYYYDWSLGFDSGVGVQFGLKLL